MAPSNASQAGAHFLNSTDHFLNLHSHDFVRVGVAVPACRVADPLFNAQQINRFLTEACECGASLVAFPELGLSAYTCEDLFHQRALLDACETGLAAVLAASTQVSCVAVVGMPLRLEHRLFNCAVVLHQGQILGVVPKTYLPNSGEFYEARQFNSADQALTDQIYLLGQTVPFGTQLVFEATDMPLLKIHIELCEDLWAPIAPSSYAALAGATVLVNLSASNATVGKARYRHQLVGQQSARCLAAYVYSSAGPGESSTDMAWDGHALIYENGVLLAESQRFASQPPLLTGDIDLERVSHERMRQSSFGQSVRVHAAHLKAFRTIPFSLQVPRNTPLPLARLVERFPYVPADRHQRDERCQEVYNIQVQALVQRLTSSGINKVVIGVSGGLDSTHALLICAKAMDIMGLPRTHILGFTLPGFATTQRTLSQAHRLMASVGCTAAQIDIRPSCMQMFKDLNHPFASGAPEYDVTFENVQAGERTSHLFRLANFHGALVVGTGDLSELALGWCTYGVGDHMSHYNVNASVPKTLIRHLVRWVAQSAGVAGQDQAVLLHVLDTVISPELVPSSLHTEEVQNTEATTGPYELQDFNLYYTLRYGFSPTKVAFLALCAWGSQHEGPGPDDPHVAKSEYDLSVIKSTLRIFLSRFFKGSQFKRSCAPNSPKVGSGGSLSPRGDWRAPSDSESAVWLAQLEKIPDALELILPPPKLPGTPTHSTKP
jgi:NAD+ synthase (glutamine-hydrolysing)